MTVSINQKKTGKRIREYFKEIDLKIFIQSSAGKSEYVRVLLKDGMMRNQATDMPVDLRNTALDVIYGKAFERNESNPVAGNVQKHYITIQADQWNDTLDRLQEKG